MFKLKDIFYGIKIRKNTSILIIILLTLTLSTAYFIFRTYTTGIIISSNNKWALKNINNLYLIKPISNELFDDSELYADALSKLKEENLGTIYGFSSYGFSDNPFIDSEFSLSGCEIDKNYYDLIKDKIIYGPGFSDDDFNSESFDTIPIILGEKIKNDYNINDTVEDNYGNKYIIKGFMKSNKYLPVDTNDLTLYLTTKDCFLTPASKSIYPLHDNIINLNDQSTSSFKSDYFTFVNFKDSIKATMDYNQNYNKRWLPYIAMALAVALLGLIISNILCIIFRKRELGIRIVLGESLKNIALNFTYENILLSCIAIIANIGFTYLSNINYIKNMQTGSIKANIDINFNLEFFLISIIIIIVLNLINSFVIYKVLKKFQPKELIGGIE